MQGGNSWGTTGILGTKDNNHLDLYTNNSFRGRWTNTGNLLIGTDVDEDFKFRVSGGPAMFSDRLFVNVFNANDTGQLFFKTEAGTYSSYIGTRGYDMIYRVRSGNDSYRFTFGNSLTSLSFTGNGAGNILVTSPNNHITLANVNTIEDGSSAISITANNYTGGDGVVLKRGTRSDSLSDPIFAARENTTDVLRVLRNCNMLLGY